MTYSNNSQPNADDPLVTVRICHEMTEAQVLRGLLEQNGIPAVIDNEHVGSIIPSLTAQMALPVKVRIEDEKNAKNILKNIQPLSSDRPYYPVDLDECPACGSSRILHYSKFIPWLLGFNKPDIEGAYNRCMACGHRWRSEGSRNENQMLIAIAGSIAVFGIILALLYIISWIQYYL